MEEIVLEGITIPVVKKKMKNMYIRVKPPEGEVKLTAPIGVSDDDIREFALSKIAWIKKQQERCKKVSVQAEGEYVTGENCYLWGKKYILDVQDTDYGSRVFLWGENVVLRIGHGSTREEREQVLNDWYRREMRRALPGVLKKCEKIVGVRAKEWRIKNMRTRWGTCNIPEQRIWLNLKLAKKPPECLEYVVVHELVHLLEREHNGVFYGYMDKFYPGWREVKVRLNETSKEG
ncbi:MAG: M48 family metallopeptidase [Lachnospiraceae bacterium]|nr:M48 family metallopeptidase [Lachnospiraceae bacterium]